MASAIAGIHQHSYYPLHFFYFLITFIFIFYLCICFLFIFNWKIMAPTILLASTYINMMYGIGPNNTITWHIPWGNQGAPVFDYTRFWIYLQGCFWMRLALESVDWVKKTAFPNVGGPILSIEGLSRQKGERENLLSLCDCLLDGTSVFSCLLTGTWTGTCTPLVPLLLRLWGWDWNHTMGFPGSSYVCSLQTAELGLI